MKIYIRSTTEPKPERALTFRYLDDYAEEADILCDLFEQSGIKYVCYDNGAYFQFVVGRSGRKWNDIMRLVNSVKSAKYDYKNTYFEQRDGRWVEVIHDTLYV